jgi:hypothetical protein
MQIPDGLIRKAYYSVPYYPIAYKDGNLNGLATIYPTYPGWLPNWTQAVIDAQYLVPAPFTMSLTWNFTPANDSVAVRIVVTATEPVTMTTPKLQVAMIERLIHFSSPPGSNGETDFENVCRKMYPDGNGTTMPTTWTTNQQQIYNFKEKIPTNVYSKTQIAFVVFIQDNSTKDVKQNSYSGPQALNSVPNFQATDDFNILLYPNPMNTDGVVSFYLDKAATVSFEIIDLLGKTVISEKCLKESGVSNIPVDADELSNGIYTIKIGVNEKIFTKKLIISK